MVKYMRCIKTGCDVICDDMIFHGDLFFHNGNLVLSGVPKGSYNNVNNSIPYLETCNKKIYYHFQSEDLFQVPCGGAFETFVIDGVFDVQDEFLKQMKEYESKECVALFE